MRKSPNLTQAVIVQFCNLHRDEGWSVRRLEIKFNIPRSTIHYYLIKFLGKGGKCKRFGLRPIIEEHLRSLPSRYQAQVQWWLAQNKQRIAELDRASPTHLLTAWQESGRSMEECWAKKDFRSMADSARWRGNEDD